MDHTFLLKLSVILD
jgi:hypothetical protein